MPADRGQSAATGRPVATCRPLDAVIYLVSRSGMDRDRAALIAEYICDRCARLSLTTVHSSGNSSLHRDAFLVRHMRLSRRQISAWLALLRGTRPVQADNGRVAGGLPGMLEVLSAGVIEPAHMRRFERLAYAAATGRLRGPHTPDSATHHESSPR